MNVELSAKHAIIRRLEGGGGDYTTYLQDEECALKCRLGTFDISSLSVRRIGKVGLWDIGLLKCSETYRQSHEKL